MSVCCDKDCNRHIVIVVILLFISLSIGYFCKNNIVKFICIIIFVCLLIALILIQNGGYKQYMQTQDDIDTISKLKYMLKLHNIVPECYLDDIPIIASDESYTFKKKKIFLCLGKGSKQFDNNTLLYVMLHEFAHVMTKPEPDPHSDTWKENFDNLLQKAINANLYDPIKGIDPEYLNKEYCGSNE